MSTTTDGYLHMDFVKFHFNKCTPKCWIRQVPHRNAKYMDMPSSPPNMYEYAL